MKKKTIATLFVVAMAGAAGAANYLESKRIRTGENTQNPEQKTLFANSKPTDQEFKPDFKIG